MGEKFTIKARVSNARALFEFGTSSISEVVFPVDAEKLREVVERLNINDFNEFKLYKFDSGYGELDKALKNASFEELQYLALKIAELDIDDRCKYMAAIDTLSGKTLTVSDLINLTDSLDNFTIRPFMSAEEYGRAIIEDDEHGFNAVWSRLEKSENEADRKFSEFISYLCAASNPETLAELIAEEENGTFTDYGYIIQQVDIAKRLTAGSNVTVFAIERDGAQTELKPFDALNPQLWKSEITFAVKREDFVEAEELMNRIFAGEKERVPTAKTKEEER